MQLWSYADLSLRIWSTDSSKLNAKLNFCWKLAVCGISARNFCGLTKCKICTEPCIVLLCGYIFFCEFIFSIFNNKMCEFHVFFYRMNNVWAGKKWKLIILIYPGSNWGFQLFIICGLRIVHCDSWLILWLVRWN